MFEHGTSLIFGFVAFVASIDAGFYIMFYMGFRRKKRAMGICGSSSGAYMDCTRVSCHETQQGELSTLPDFNTRSHSYSKHKKQVKP